MNSKYLFIAALLGIFLAGCKKDEPVNNGTPQENSQEVVDELNDLVDGLGTIVSTQTLEDGTIVMTDDKGNKITKDKDGNITIVMKNGETILIDNSINEDESAPLDKWYDSRWQTNTNVPDSPDYYEPIPNFIYRIQELGFEVDQEDISLDTTISEQILYDLYCLHFHKTTVSLQQKDTLVNHTYTQSTNYIKLTLHLGEIGDDDFKYELAIMGDYIVVYWKHYYYDSNTGTYEVDDSGEAFRSDEGYNIEPDNSILLYQGTEQKNSTATIVSTKSQTTFFNYHRLNETQLAANNNSASYLLKEIGEDIPDLEAYDLDGNKLKTFELVSF